MKAMENNSPIGSQSLHGSSVSSLGGSRGLTIWLTGLSSSGKTTTALRLSERLSEMGLAVECLDGDTLRERIGRELGFSREDRLENVRRAIYISEMLNRHGVISIVSLITPYEEMRQLARSSLPSYFEVYVDCSLEECDRRDVKGLYAKARRGEIAMFTGVSDSFEIPEKPELILHTDQHNVEYNVQLITAALPLP